METGICTSVWGSPAWFYLTSVASGYPIDPDEYDLKKGNPKNYTRKTYVNFYKYVGKTLPCSLCRISYERFLEEIPIEIYTDSRKSMMKFVFDMHNKVNEKLGIRQEPDNEKIYRKFEAFHARCPKSEQAKGCIEPKDDFVKMRCRVITEPYHRNSKLYITVFTSVSLIVFILFLKMKYK